MYGTLSLLQAVLDLVRVPILLTPSLLQAVLDLVEDEREGVQKRRSIVQASYQ